MSSSSLAIPYYKNNSYVFVLGAAVVIIVW